MQFIVIILIMVSLFIFILRNKVKLDLISLGIITLIAYGCLKFVSTDTKAPITYMNFDNSMMVTEVWQNYSNQDLTNDLQVSRMINPYQNQVTPVIEPNSVVYDENSIYSISNKKVVITGIHPLQIKKEITFIGQSFEPMNLFVTEKNFVVIGQLDHSTRVYIYDKATMKEIKNLEMNSIYITSRIIDGDLYLVTSNIIDTKAKTKIRPSYKENGKEHIISYEDLYYVNNTYPNNFVNILKTSLNEEDKTQVLSYLGLGQTIYFAPRSIYLAEERYSKEGNSNRTILIKIDQQSLKVSGLQEVPGYVLDQYSLDEYEGFLRVATTTRDTLSNSNLYVLGPKMQIIGKLENFSNENEIQAATFIKDKAYIETFNILDPFYVIDLSNPKRPKILNELKFDGYNTNFIPYDENHILAFGLVLNDQKQSEGIKVAIYDVSNPNKVVIQSKDTIMYSEYNSAYTDVLYNNQMLLLDQKNHVLGFPILYWISPQNTTESFSRQFYLVYDTNKHELKRLGKISHYEKGKLDESNDEIKRAIVMNGVLYTVSDRFIKENQLYDLKLMNEIKLT